MVTIIRPEFSPDPSLDTEQMKALQHDIATTASFTDTGSINPGHLDETLVAGVDQAFTDDHAISAIVVMQGESVVDQVTAVAPLDVPYIPGLLAFREGGSILAAFQEL
ncbi:MAG: endonuclease V, partial [Halobacteriales archaeon]|nr:endonuclease V [Halobacteriales archaeon]